MSITNLGESGKLALSHAERIAKQAGFDQIGAEHLFLGVAELEDVNIRRQFQKVGVDMDEVSQKIRKELGTEARVIATGGFGGQILPEVPA